METTVWGIHNDHPELHIEDLGIVSIGWDEVGDLQTIGPDRERLKEEIARHWPNAKPGAIPVWAGVLYRFAFEIQQGDVVIYPYKPDRTLFFGRVAGDYYFDDTASQHRNRRKVDWFIRDQARTAFSQAALYEIGSAVTVFKVKNHAAEFERFISDPSVVSEAVDISAQGEEPETAATQAEGSLSAKRIDDSTRDFIAKTLLNLDVYDFEEFTAALLGAIGYRARVTQKSGDGGVDVIASQDPLSLGPHVIKVQCKRTVGTIGSPDVQKLLGTLTGLEQGLFVTLGTYAPAAEHLAQTKEGLRLLKGSDLVDLILQNYEQLDDRWKRALPLRQMYVVDIDPAT